MILMFVFSSLVSHAAFSTSDYLPHRRGEMMIVLIPDKKFVFKRLISCVLSVKSSTEADFPKIKGVFMVNFFTKKTNYFVSYNFVS